MININYVVTDDFEEIANLSATEFDENGDLEGFFEIIVGDLKHGFINYNLIENGFSGDELIGSWFERLLKSYKCLFLHDRVFLNDIESAKTWLLFERNGDWKISLSIVKADKFDGCKYTELNLSNYEVIKSSAKIEFKTLILETMNKLSKLINELTLVNQYVLESNRVTRLLSLRKEVENLFEQNLLD